MTDPERSERPISIEEVLLRDDLNGVFQQQANIVGLCYLNKHPHKVIELLAGHMADFPDLVRPMIVLVRPSNNNTYIILKDGPPDAISYACATIPARNTPIWREDNPVPLNEEDFMLLRRVIGGTEWDERATQEAVSLFDEMPDFWELS